MTVTTTQKRAVEQYYKDLAAYAEKHVTHETAVRSAFQNLLAAFAQSANWVLIPEQALGNGKRPDGTLRDAFNLPRGYWEAKDGHDDLQIEIRKKISLGYPISNTIFEDTRRAILYQNNRVAFEADLTNPKDLTVVLDTFFHYAAPDIATFEHAVADFKESIPDLAQGLMQRIQEEHARNKPFVAAFQSFLDLCRTSLDPNMSRATVDEMLIQHLLTERLFRTIFNNSDFTRRNAIAAEIETVIQALTSRAFNRYEFLKSLDRFYIAIENAARNLDDWSEKQHFINIVYERFFQGFSVKQADTHGIVYTPQEIVDFMCASVEEVLQREFGTSIAEPGVQILDPCVGTGSFIVNLLHRIPRSKLRHKYLHDLYCNEIMLLPYYIASLNIEHEYYERTGEYLPFEGICFADTLELAQGQQMSMFVEENTERVKREKDAPIMVVIGNPPYNVGQRNENDNNKNRKYPVIDQRIKETYVKDSKATLRTQLYDAYVRFFRWATDRLQGRDGVVCFISNNSFVDQITFDSMRKHLLQDFTQVYHLDLHGNVRKNPKLSGTTHNVFGIQVGVGITIAVRSSEHQTKTILYHRLPEYWHKTQKLAFLAKQGSIGSIEWKELQPDNRNTWITEGLHLEFTHFLPMGTKESKSSNDTNAQAIFKTYSAGVNTSRDSIVYDFNSERLANRMTQFIEDYNSEVSRWVRAGRPIPIDDFVHYDKVKWSRNLKRDLRNVHYAQFVLDNIRKAIYRPFTKICLYFADIVVDELGTNRSFFPISTTEAENKAILLKVGSEWPMFALAIKNIPDYLPQGGSRCLPYYTYSEDGSNRRENITDWALAQFQAKYGSDVTKWDIFHYVYAMLHHPQYRERYAENLKRDLPHIPLLHNNEPFLTCVRIGKRLMELHLHYEQAKEYPLQWLENQDIPFSWHVKKMRLTTDKTALVVNESLTLAAIPPECFAYRLGNRSALDWIIDQYQVSEDKRSGIVSDPNNADDEEYIVRLVGKVVTVSVETVKLVDELAKEVKQEEWLG